MDRYKVKFTILEEKILNFLFVNPTTTFHGRELARKLNVSPTAISMSIRKLLKKNLINIKKNVMLSISLNRENKDVFNLKRVENLKAIYESGLMNLLNKTFPGSTIIVFGSYAYGEDTEGSDIDIAVIGSNKKNVNLSNETKKLQREIQLHFFHDMNMPNKNLKENIVNGIVLKGAIEI